MSRGSKAALAALQTYKELLRKPPTPRTRPLSDQPTRRAARSKILDTERDVLDTKFFARRIRNDEQRADYIIPRWKY
jgi:hypothetical protein